MRGVKAHGEVNIGTRCHHLIMDGGTLLMRVSPVEVYRVWRREQLELVLKTSRQRRHDRLCSRAGSETLFCHAYVAYFDLTRIPTCRDLDKPNLAACLAVALWLD